MADADRAAMGGFSLLLLQQGYEPPHIHVDKGGNTAKFWLEPVSLARNVGFPDRVLGALEGKVVEERVRFLEAWNEYFSRHS